MSSKLVPPAFLIVLTLFTHFLRLGDLTLRGEETRWVQSAREMIWTGDWLVPRQQGEPFLYRPPLGSWLIAIATLLRGECDVLAIRLPSALATLLTTLLVYCYARRFLSVVGALGAGLAYTTMGQVLELGHVAESDSLFALFVCGSLFAWHALYGRRGSTALTWAVAYALAALGTLAKGPQAPAYFVGPVVVYLCWIRDWRGLLSRSHALGLLTFCLMIDSWQIPVLAELGWMGLKQAWWYETALRFQRHDGWSMVQHGLTYPFETLICTAPWSLLLFGLLSPKLRDSLSGDMRSNLAFLVICLLVTYPTCWLAPGARGRHFMGLYPCIAVLAGVVLDRLAHAEPQGWWRCFTGKRAVGWGTVGIAVLVSGVSTGLVTTLMVQTSEDTAGAVAELKRQLPAEHRLVSFERVHHIFAYHYGAPIELRSFPAAPAGLDEEPTYFCFDRYGRPEECLPFAWEEVAVIPCDRNRKHPSQCVVVIGRVVAKPSQ